MNTRSTPTRRVEENDVHEDIPPQVDQVPQDGKGAQGDHIPNVEGGIEVSEMSNREIERL